jgi:hypothetical protein
MGRFLASNNPTQVNVSKRDLIKASHRAHRIRKIRGPGLEETQKEKDDSSLPT